MLQNRKPFLNVTLSPYGGIRVSVDDHQRIEAYIDQQESQDNASASAQIEYDQRQHTAEHEQEVTP
jgi:hypothetical protein